MLINGIPVQSQLVSGTNIKTINSTSLLGSGDVAVQATLVSGTNIVTINGSSLLGSGNLVVSASPSGVAGAIQFSNGSAFSSDAANLFFDDTNNRLGVGTNAPTATTHIKGAGATSATTSLLVQNSAGTNSLQCTDDLSVFNHGKGAVATNTIFGKGAAAALTTAANTTVFGVGALAANTTQSGNTAIGQNALNQLYGTFSVDNVAVGRNAMANSAFNVYYNTAIGTASLSGNQGSSNTAVGYNTSVPSGFSRCVVLGADTAATGSNQFCVGGSGAGQNVGTVVAEVNTSANVWNVRINGVARKILLA